jgi:hypothetical protein
MGVTLPDIQHPMSRMSNPGNLDVRGVSRGGLADVPGPQASGRPLASEDGMGGSAHRLRKSISAGSGRDSRQRNGGPQMVRETINIDSIPEGVEVKYGDPAATRLPVFGKSLFFK